MQDLSYAGPMLLGIAIMTAFLLTVVVVMLVRTAIGRSRVRKADGGDNARCRWPLQEAVNKLKAQERQMAARAEASERLFWPNRRRPDLRAWWWWIESGVVQTLNPAARRILGVEGVATGGAVAEVLRQVPALADVIAEALETTAPIARRTLTIEGGVRPAHLGVTVSHITGVAGDMQAVVCLFTDLTGWCSNSNNVCG